MRTIVYNSLLSIHQAISYTNKHNAMCPCARLGSNADTSCSSSKASQTPKSSRLTQLPMEMVLYIFSFMEGDDLACSCYLVCRAWHLCSKDESTWKRLYHNHEDVALFKKVMNCPWYEAGMWYLYCTKVCLYSSFLQSDIIVC